MVGEIQKLSHISFVRGWERQEKTFQKNVGEV